MVFRLGQSRCTRLKACCSIWIALLFTASITTRAASADPDGDPAPAVSPSQKEAANLKKAAVAVSRQVAAAYPEDPLSYALLGSAFYNTGRSEDAVQQLRKCLELSPNMAEAYEILARISYEKGQLDETVRLCQEALKRGPANPEVLNQLGKAFMDQGRTDEAVRTFGQAVELPDAVSESSYLLGQANFQSGRYAAAKESFERAITLLPDHTQAYFGLYTACLRMGQTEEAARSRERFQKLEATDRRSFADRSAQEDSLTGLPMVRETVARTFFGAGQIYQAHQEPAKAAELIRKAASLDGEKAVYRAALEAFYLQTKQITEGAKVFEQLALEQPGSRLNYLFLGRFRARLDQIDAAADAYRKAQELGPQWAEGYRALADLYLRADRKPAEARVSAQRAVELEPKAPHYYLLAVACARCGDKRAAVDAMQHAVELNPNEPRFRQLLEELKTSH